MTMKTRSSSIGSQRIVQLLALLAIITAGQEQSHALGLRIPNQDPEALGRANAFAATADNPSAIYYNPAGITQLQGHNLQVSSLAYFNIYADYESPSGTKVENHHEVLPVPAFHYTYTPDDSRFTLGLGVFAPFGLAMKWPGDAPFRTTGIEGSLDYITVNPVVAYKLHDSLSIAAGPTINVSRINLQRGIGMIPGDTFQFKGDGMDYGFNAGLLWQPHAKWSFGLSYRSATEVDYEGTATAQPAPPFPGSFNSSASVKYPQIVIVGVSYRPTTNWNFEFDVDWADWSTLNEITITGAGTTQLGWESSCFYEFGVTRNLKNGWYVSAGYFFSENTTPDRYYNPIIPDGDLHVVTVGVGHKAGHWNWSVALAMIGGQWNSVDNTADPSVAGKYKLFTPALSASIAYHF